MLNVFDNAMQIRVGIDDPGVKTFLEKWEVHAVHYIGYCDFFGWF
ncbi:MAG: hypothetical protein V1668_02285 [Patescibacteria group bacterium]